MKLESNSRFERSRVFTGVDFRQDSVTVASLISGRKFRLETNAYRVLQSFDSPSRICDVNARLPELGEPTVKRVAEFLRQHRIIVPEGDTSHVRDASLQMSNRAFFGLSSAVRDDEPGVLRMVGVPYGGGNIQDGGTAQAPNALRVWQQKHAVNLSGYEPEKNFERYFRFSEKGNLKRLIKRVGEGRLADLGDLFIYPYEDRRLTFDKLSRLSSELFGAGDQALFVGGDHSITFPLLRGFASSVPEFHLIHIDAHTDLYQTKLDEAFDFQYENHHGNFLFRALTEIPELVHVHQFGIRGINNVGSGNSPSKVSTHWIGETVDLIRRRKVLKAMGIPDGAAVYISLDLDVLDPATAPGVSTPVAGGLSYPELLDLLVQLSGLDNVIGADLVELNPRQDHAQLSHQISSELMLCLIACIR